VERALFVLSLCALTFAYVAATMEFKIPPYSLLREAKLGWAAWAGKDTSRRAFPQAFEGFEPEAAAIPQARRLAPEAGAEHVLITGGPYQLLERCPKWGCMAWITDRAGRIVHTWEVDLDELWSGLTGISGDVNRLSLYPVGMALGADGSLVVTFQGRNTYPVHIGIAKLDRDGRILWKRFDQSHHWPTMDAQGRIYTPATFAVRGGAHYVGTSSVALKCRTGEARPDLIRVLSAEGKPLRELALFEGFVRSGYAGLFYSVQDGCNPTHLNSIALASPEVAKALPNAAAGDFLVSLRETSAIALLDRETGAVKYLVSGRSAAQHAAQFLPDGSVLVVDNLGGERSLGGTRVVRIDLATGASRTVFPRGGEKELLPVTTDTAGQIDVSRDGRRALVALTHQGRVIEIDVESGRALWAYDNTHELGPFLEQADLRAEATRARFATYGAYYVRGKLQ
jgi:outer membrane protein assembly factor BamB